MTDQQLRQALARMLPGRISIWFNNSEFRWSKTRETHYEERTIHPTEWLHICWLAEQTLTVNEWTPFLDHLDKITTPVHICPTTHAMANICASWQQRALALVKVKGVEV